MTSTKRAFLFIVCLILAATAAVMVFSFDSNNIYIENTPVPERVSNMVELDSTWEYCKENGLIKQIRHFYWPDTNFYASFTPFDGIKILQPNDTGGNLNPIYAIPDTDNGNEELFAVYMSVIFREPSVKFDFWNEDYWTEFVTQRNIWTRDLYYAYTNGTRQCMIDWFLEYEDMVASMFPPTLPKGTIMHVGRNFSIPNLSEHYYTYMPVRSITARSSYQFQFRPHLSPDNFGFMRYGDAYAVALGTYYGITIGGIYEIEFADGEVIFAVLGDVKRDSETDPTNRFHPAPGTTNMRIGNIIEFIMDDSPWIHLDASSRVNEINQVVRERFSSAPVRITFLGVSEHATVR